MLAVYGRLCLVVVLQAFSAGDEHTCGILMESAQLLCLGENTNSNLILLPNSPASASNMLSDMVTSFVASQQIGEDMKVANQKLLKEAKEVKLPG